MRLIPHYAIEIACVVLAVLATCSYARPDCLSHAEARKVHPRGHLMWHRVDGQRCWSPRDAEPARPRERERLRGPVPNDGAGDRTPAYTISTIDAVAILYLRQEPVDDPFMYVQTPPLDQGVLVPWPEVVRHKLLTAWQPAQREDDEPEVIYSTFDGEPPLVWPVLEKNQWSIDVELIAKYVGEMLTIGASAMLFGWIVSPMVGRWLWGGL